MKDNNKYCVYIHSCKISNKAYIGITNQSPKKRWGTNGIRYLEKYPNGEYVQPVFARAINKYADWDNDWDHIIFMDNLSEDDAKQIEMRLIALFKTNVCRYGDDAMGYNCTDGGEGCSGRPCSEQMRKRLSEARMGENNPMYGVRLTGDKNPMHGRTGDKHPNYGKHLSEETKQKIRLANTGRRHSDETREKMSISRTGKQLSDAHKQKLSQAHKGKRLGNERHNAKSVIQLDDFGNFIKEWDCMASADKALGICRGCISQCLKGEQKHAGGYCWVTTEEYYSLLNEVEK